jgi:hypothetical protein
MANGEITELKRIFLTRLDMFSHLLDVGEKHFPDFNAVLQERLVADMFPLGTQVAFACNNPRGFSQWCAGQPIENLSRDVMSLKQARTYIQESKTLISSVTVGDDKLNEIKRVGMGGGRYCELPARQYVNDYLLPNFYFHITTAYAIMRMLGAPLGKADFLCFLAPHIKVEN